MANRTYHETYRGFVRTGGDNGSVGRVVNRAFCKRCLTGARPLNTSIPGPVSRITCKCTARIYVLSPGANGVRGVVTTRSINGTIGPLSYRNRVRNNIMVSVKCTLERRCPVSRGYGPVSGCNSLKLFHSRRIPRVRTVIVSGPNLSITYKTVNVKRVASVPATPTVTSTCYEFSKREHCDLPLSGAPCREGGWS